ncbi:MAG: T9SS type A sorting domain-containing protein [Flavobacteriales bacterium]|jgi:hypothetical protein
MKHTFTALTVCLSLTAFAQHAQLITEKVDNGDMVPGNTFRVWAQLNDPQHTLHLVWGDAAHPLSIVSTAPFYQHAAGSHSSVGMNDAVIAIQPQLAFDSYITVGYDRAMNNNLWELGVDFSSFNQGGAINTTNGAWFLLPTDQKCAPASNGLVLIGQFTTTGTASGTMNLQGWVAPQEPWRDYGLAFTTTDAKVFGCMNASAANYNPNATFDNGTCEGISGVVSVSPVANVAADPNGWDVFPNPVRESLIHVQFHGGIGTADAQTRFDIFDMSGKLVGTHPLSSGAMISGNRVTLQQELAPGTYSVVLVKGATTDSRTIIVQR